MAMEDPFFLVKEEVLQSLRNAQGLHAQLSDLIDNQGDSKRVESIQGELNKAIKSIEWDLQDLDQTIGVAQRNPGRFQMGLREIQSRRQFVTDTKADVDEIKRSMNSESMKARIQSNQRQALFGDSSPRGPKRAQGKYAKMENELRRGNQDFIDDQLQRQQQIMREQDQDLGKVSQSVHVLGQMGEEIGNELDDHNRMLGDFSHELEHTDSRLTSLVNRVDKISRKAGDKCQIITIVVLVIILVIVIVLFIIPF